MPVLVRNRSEGLLQRSRRIGQRMMGSVMTGAVTGLMVGLMSGLLLGVTPVTAATTVENVNIKVYQDPNCGCCSEWVRYMESEGFKVESIQTSDVNAYKQQFGVPPKLASCHTAVIEQTGQVIEGHVPAAAVRKMLTDASVKGVAAPGMPMNSPGMGQMDGNLVTVDFQGRAFSRD